MQTDCSNCENPATSDINGVSYCKDCVYKCFIMEPPPTKKTHTEMMFAIMEKNEIKKYEIAQKIEALKNEMLKLSSEREKIYSMTYEEIEEIYNKK